MPITWGMTEEMIYVCDLMLLCYKKLMVHVEMFVCVLCVYFFI